MDELRRGESEQGGEDVIQPYQWQLSRTPLIQRYPWLLGHKRDIQSISS